MSVPHIVAEYGKEDSIAVVASVFILALILSMTLNIGMLKGVFRRVEELDRRHRLRIDFVSATMSGDSDAVHNRATAFLDNADVRNRCEIFAVNSYLEATTDGARETESTRDYYSTIEQLVADGARYMRVVQLPEEMARLSYEQWAGQTKDHYKVHFDNVLKMQDNVQFAQLVQTRPRFPLSFLLIRNTDGSNYLIWQVDEQIPESEQGRASFRLHGIFLVEDPDCEVVNHFLWCVDQLRQKGTVVMRSNHQA